MKLIRLESRLKNIHIGLANWPIYFTEIIIQAQHIVT